MFPFAGAMCTAYWWYGDVIFSWTSAMHLCRFKQIRSVRYFKSNSSEVKCKDVMHNMHPILNILKKRLGAFLIPGSELSLDEASCASRSNYGRAFIFFNPAKNCRNFHFRFYMLCDASAFCCLTLKVVTWNDSDHADPEETLESIQQEANYSLLNKLVIEMCLKFNNTGRTVNMDNYYNYPAVLILLRNRDVYARGTVKKNNRMVPSQIVLIKAESKQLPDGYVSMKVCEFAKMKYFGWNNNKPVHVLSTTDASGPRSMVMQQRGSKHMMIPCPLSIFNYTNNMQGVDCHDQLRSRFALASRHGFKKYYITMQLAQIDMGITNAAILLLDANPHLKKKKGARYSFVEDIAEHLMYANSIDWEGIYCHSTLDLDSGATKLLVKTATTNMC
jgi:hypothetical protein